VRVVSVVYLLRVNPHSATTASLIIVGITSLAGVAVHLRAGRVRVRSGIVLGAGAPSSAAACRRPSIRTSC